MDDTPLPGERLEILRRELRDEILPILGGRDIRPNRDSFGGGGDSGDSYGVSCSLMCGERRTTEAGPTAPLPRSYRS
jgi:hypothetical protein